VDFVELVESVTYAVCGDDNVDFEKFRIIFEDKNVRFDFIMHYQSVENSNHKNEMLFVKRC